MRLWLASASRCLCSELVALGAPLRPVQKQVSVVEGRQQVSALHDVTGADGSLANEPFERGDGGSLYLRFHHRSCGNTVFGFCERQSQNESDGANGTQFQRRTSSTQQRREAFTGRIDDAAGDRPVRPHLQVDDGPKQGGNGLGQLQRLFVEGCTGMTLEGDGAERPALTVGEHDRHQRGVSAS